MIKLNDSDSNNNIDVLKLYNESQRNNEILQNKLKSLESTKVMLEGDIAQLSYELMDKNNYIQKVNNSQWNLINENERLRLEIKNSTKDTDAETEELERKTLTMKQEIEKLNGLVKRQRKNITETQNLSKSKIRKLVIHNHKF